MNKIQANEIAASAICHLDGKWENTTFYNLSWVPSIESIDCPGLSMIYQSCTNEWCVYIEPKGYYGSGKTPNMALSTCRKELEKEAIKIQQSLFDTQQIIDLISDK